MNLQNFFDIIEGDESHFMSEITGVKIVPIIEHEGKGINKFLENSFAGNSKEELLIILDEIFKMDIKNFT